jgi:hypothetical protein
MHHDGVVLGGRFRRLSCQDERAADVADESWMEDIFAEISDDDAGEATLQDGEGASPGADDADDGTEPPSGQAPGKIVLTCDACKANSADLCLHFRSSLVDRPLSISEHPGFSIRHLVSCSAQ